MGKEKIVQMLEDNTEVVTCKGGWNPKEVSGEPALLQGWKPGSPSHHSISYGMLLACKEKVEHAYIGEFLAEDDKGEEVKVPVFNPIAINTAMEEAFVEKFDLDVKLIKMATNRTGAAKKLTAIKEQMAKLDPKVLEAIKESDPVLYETLTGKKAEDDEEESSEESDEDSESEDENEE